MSNPYAAFMNLLPKQVKTLGKITFIDSNGTVKISSISGNDSMTVKGGTDGYLVNDVVMVVDGVIVSKLANTQSILVESII